MILTPPIEMVEDLEGDQEDPTKEAMIIETPVLMAATHTIQRMRVPTKIRVFLSVIHCRTSNPRRTRWNALFNKGNGGWKRDDYLYERI